MTVLVLLAVWFVFPKILKIFTDMGIKIPIQTRMLIYAGDFMQDYGVFVMVGLVLTVIGFAQALKKSLKFKSLVDLFILRTPIFGRLLRAIEIERFGLVFGSLLDAGLPATSALDSLVSSTTLRPFKKIYKKMLVNLDSGIPIGTTLSKDELALKMMPPAVIHLVRAGENSGKLAEVLSNLSVRYRAKVEQLSSTLSQALEPLLLGAVSLGVAFIALSIIAPIYGIYGSFQGGAESEIVSKITDAALGSLPKVKITAPVGETKVEAKTAPDSTAKTEKYYDDGEILTKRSEAAGWVEIVDGSGVGLWVKAEYAPWYEDAKQ